MFTLLAHMFWCGGDEYSQEAKSKNEVESQLLCDLKVFQPPNLGDGKAQYYHICDDCEARVVQPNTIAVHTTARHSWIPQSLKWNAKEAGEKCSENCPSHNEAT